MRPETDAVRELARDIHRCHMLSLALGDPLHPCRKVVGWQGLDLDSERYVPESWAGHLALAPILFISSNPSAGPQNAPFDARWERGSRSTDDELFEAADSAFDPGPWPGIIDGIYNRDQGGQRIGRWVSYWAWARRRASELLDRQPVPGTDYALTELVHCGSRDEHGVDDALAMCTQLYLSRVLSLAAAKVFVLTGKKARSAGEAMLGIHLDDRLWGPGELLGRRRCVIALPHSNERGSLKSIDANLGPERSDVVRAFLKRSDDTSALLSESASQRTTPEVSGT